MNVIELPNIILENSGFIVRESPCVGFFAWETLGPAVSSFGNYATGTDDDRKRMDAILNRLEL